MINKYFVAVIFSTAFCLIVFVNFDQTEIVNSEIVSKLSNSLSTKLKQYVTNKDLSTDDANLNITCDQIKFLTVSFDGIKSGAGVGNQLFEILSLLGMAKKIHRVPFTYVHNTGLVNVMLELQKVFPELIYRINFEMLRPEEIIHANIHHKGCCKFAPYDNLLNYEDKFLMAHGIYLQSQKYFWHMKDELLNLMQLSKYATTTLNSSIPDGYISGPCLCVHARLGDFITAPHPMPSQANFTREAARHILSQMPPKSKVLLISNDPGFMFNTFRDVYFNGTKTPLGVEKFGIEYIIPNISSAHLTLALARKYCSTVLITAPASTFGWFIGFLGAGGTADVFFSEHYAKPNGGLPSQFEPVDFFPPHWVPLRMEGQSIIPIEIREIVPF